MATGISTHHFLIVTLGIQGQINPARHLAHSLARTTGARVTVATPLYSHRRLFPTSSTPAGHPDSASVRPPLHPGDGFGVVSYSPYSDGYENSFQINFDDAELFRTTTRSAGSRTLLDLGRALAACGRPVTCVVYTILLPWAAEVARELGVPSILFWTQPASVFAIYYHYVRGHPGFHGEEDFVELPGLPPLRLKDLPSIFAEQSPFRVCYEEHFAELDRSTPGKVLVNTFRELEAQAIDGVNGVELLAIGPMDATATTEAAVVEEKRDLFEATDSRGYMEWLDSQEQGSVVYASFGSLTQLPVRQVEEIGKALKESGRPFIWALRKDGRKEGAEVVAEEGKGMVVEWCEQARVLHHRAVGCFVTHCGWNSMTEAMVSGVPMVMVPQWVDQATNARLAEVTWGVGVKVEVGEDRVVVAGELRRCLEVVMGGGEQGREIRRMAEMWKEKAAEAITDGGLAEKTIWKFVSDLTTL